MESRRDSQAFVDATIVAALVIVIDQLSKAWMQEWLAPPAGQRRYEVAGNILAFEYLENRGAAFGLFAGQSWLLTIGAVVVGIGLVGAFREELRHSVLARTGLALIVGGGIGNLIDRVARGYVVDFVAVGIWPKFNVADSCVTIGMGLLLFHLFRDRADHQG